MKFSQQDNFLTPRGLERRLKRHFAKKSCDFLATTTPGFEPFLENEISGLEGARVTATIGGGVEFSGPIDLVYEANLYVRTANRIVMRIDSFTARSYPELFNKCAKIDWELYIGFNRTLSLNASSSNSRLHHTENISASVFEAIQKSLGKLGLNIVREKEADIRIHIRFSDDTCTLSIDSSGELLYKRGYRTHIGEAPLRETLAASILSAARWDTYGAIVDPMCGSGTILLEAALMAHGRAPGMDRAFAFQSWPSFNESKWDRIKAVALSKRKNDSQIKILGSDIDEKALTAATDNAQKEDVAGVISFQNKNCLDLSCKEVAESGLIISNLPYGKRIGTEKEIRELIKSFGMHLRSNCRGWDFGFITAEENFEKLSGLTVEKEIRFRNGGLAVRFVMGRIYNSSSC